MITKALIDRINALYHKRITEGLTPEEEAEQAELRREYLAGIRAQVKQSLDRIRIVDENGKNSDGDGECDRIRH